MMTHLKIIIGMIVGAFVGILLFKSMETYTYLYGIIVGMLIIQTV